MENTARPLIGAGSNRDTTGTACLFPRRHKHGTPRWTQSHTQKRSSSRDVPCRGEEDRESEVEGEEKVLVRPLSRIEVYTVPVSKDKQNLLGMGFAAARNETRDLASAQDLASSSSQKAVQIPFRKDWVYVCEQEERWPQELRLLLQNAPEDHDQIVASATLDGQNSSRLVGTGSVWTHQTSAARELYNRQIWSPSMAGCCGLLRDDQEGHLSNADNE